jgi:hypothetical protein
MNDGPDRFDGHDRIDGHDLVKRSISKDGHDRFTYLADLKSRLKSFFNDFIPTMQV